MKTSQLFCALFAIALFFPLSHSFAATAVSAKEAREGFIKKIAAQEGSLLAKVADTKVAKKALRLAKALGANKVDFQTEPTKWLWYGVAAIVIGVAFQIFGWGFFTFGLLAYFGSLLVFFGCLSILYWFLKKEGLI